jgi:hypothetical protein
VAEPNVYTLYPSELTKKCKPVRIDSSSSTIAIVGTVVKHAPSAENAKEQQPRQRSDH